MPKLQLKSQHVIRMLGRSAKEKRDGNKKDKIEDQFLNQEKTIMDQEQRITELETLNQKLELTVDQYKDLHRSSCKLAGMVCFKMADIQNEDLVLKENIRNALAKVKTEKNNQILSTDFSFSLENGVEAYEKMVKEKSDGFVSDESLQSFSVLANLLKSLEKKSKSISDSLDEEKKLEESNFLMLKAGLSGDKEFAEVAC